MLGFFTRCNRQFGDLVALRFGHRHVHLATHPDFVEQILVSDYRNFGKSYVFELLRPVLGNGLVNSEGAFWLRQRRLMQPAFSRSSVANYAPAIVDSTPPPDRRLRRGETRDLHREMNRLALAIVGKALHGRRPGQRRRRNLPTTGRIVPRFQPPVRKPLALPHVGPHAAQPAAPSATCACSIKS